VVGPGGTSVLSAADKFSYVAAAVPSVNGVSPNNGPATGGTYVTIVGSGFSSSTKVFFGSLSQNAYPSDDSHIYAIAPPGAAGSGVDIKVGSPAGTSATSLADRYTYVASAVPSVRGITPNRGPTGGGTGVQILGNGFSGATSVRFGTAAATISYNYGDSIFVKSPP
jgi:hypothetical protein